MNNRIFVLRILAMALMLLLLTAFLVKAFLAAYYFAGYPANGPFQLLNPLRRLAEGQLPYRDFPLFHGFGVNLVFYPFFALLGKDLFASEIVRQFLPPVVAFFSIWLALYALIRQWAIAIAAALFCGFAALLPGPLMAFFEPWFFPGPSLLGLRAAYPLILLSLLAIGVDRHKPSFVRTVVFGLLIGAAPFWSYEQGAYVAIAAMCALACSLRWSRDTLLRSTGELATLLLSASGTLWGLFSVASGGYGAAALAFAFGIIPAEQGWYFGAPPNETVKSLEDLFIAPVLHALWSCVICTVVCGLAMKKHRAKWRISSGQLILVLGLTAYAWLSIASFAGMIAKPYAMPSARSAAILGAGAAYGVYLRWGCRLPARLLTSFSAIAVISFSAAAVGVTLTLLARHQELAAEFANVPLNKKLGVKLTPAYYGRVAEALAIIEAVPSAKVFSTYTGPLDFQLGQWNVSGSDYIIHALGDEARKNYLQQFQKESPNFVFTMNWKAFYYESWLHWANAEFYEALVSGYRPVWTGDHTVLWERRGEPAPITPRNCQEIGHGFPVQGALAESTDRRAFLLDIHALAYSPYQKIPLLNALPSFLVSISGGRAVSSIRLRPGETRRRLIAIAPPGKTLTVSPKIMSLLPGTSLSLKSVRVCEIALDAATAATFEAPF